MCIWKIIGRTFDYFVRDESFDSAIDRVRQLDSTVSGGCAVRKLYNEWIDLRVSGDCCDHKYDMTHAIYAVSKGGCILKVWEYPDDKKPSAFDITGDIGYCIEPR